jgi:hypothetical protein
LFLLIAGAGLFWILAVTAVRQLGGGDLALVYSGTSMLLCLVPGVLTLVWAQWASRKEPDQLALVILGATGIRMFGVLLAGYLLVQMVPLYREQDGFLYWLLVCYLFTLTLEVALLLKGRHRPDGSA